MIDSRVQYVVDDDNMASTNDEPLPVHSWLIQWLTNATSVVNYRPTVKL